MDELIELKQANVPSRGRDEESEGARDENDAIIRREKATREQFEELITVFLDGYRVELPKAVPVTDAQGNPVRGSDGEYIPRNSTIYDAAMKLVATGAWTQAELDNRIPVLCHQPHMQPVGVCRMCSVWIVHTKRGKPREERKLLPACHHLVTDAMRVATRVGREGFAPDAEAVLRGWTVERAGQQARKEGKTWGAEEEAKELDEFNKNWSKYLPQVDRWSGDIRSSQKVLGEMLMADHSKPELSSVKRFENELESVAKVVGATEPRERFARSPESVSRNNPAERRSRRLELPLARNRIEPEQLNDRSATSAWEAWNNTIDETLPYSSRTVVVDHDRCILCDRCVRACSEVKPFKVIGHTGKGYTTRISFDLDNLMGESSCVQCGECMTSCPTGALSLRRRVQPRAWDDSPEAIPLNPNTPFKNDSGFLTADEMRAVRLRYLPPGGTELEEISPFATVPFAYLKWNEGSVRKRVIPAGVEKELCREGEYASTAFLTDGTGSCVIYGRPKGDPPKPPGFFARLFRPKEAAAQARGGFIREATGAEFIQGEIACLTHTRRTATVVAVAKSEPMTVYEITRNLLHVMQRSPAIRDTISGLFAFRAIETALRKGEIFRALTADRKKQLTAFLSSAQLELRRLDADQLIVKQGDLVGSEQAYFYIIRTGTVRIFRTEGGQDRVLNTLSAGEYFGEAALRGESPTRTASVATLDPVELVLIPKATFLEIGEKFPEVNEVLIEVAEARKKAPAVPSDLLTDFVEQGLYQAQKLLALDLVKCTRCDECTKACADSHPDGHARLLREGLRFGDFLVATSCRSCHKPYCMDGCPVDAIHRRGNHLEVVIEDHCIGCGLCEKNCPYGAIHMVPRETPFAAAAGFAEGNPNATAARKAANCDLCNGTEPFCVEACPHDAAFRIDGKGLLQIVQARQ